MNATEKGELMTEETVLCRVHADSREEALRLAADRLARDGHVRDGFCRALLERERKFPTGICLGSVCVAIPHAEPGYVRTPALLVMTLEGPVNFVNMEDCDHEIPVSVIFVLAFTDGERHLNVLQKLSALIRDSGRVERLLGAGTDQELYHILQDSPLGEL